MRRLTLVTRSYCHLCEEMDAALSPLLAEFDVALDRVDVDADANLLARYDELVPVLLHEGRELCHYWLDAAKVSDYLGKIG